MKKTTRKSVSIKSGKIKQYIEEEAKKRGVSETFFVETLIEKNMTNPTAMNKPISKKNTSLFTSYVKGNEKLGKEGLIIASESTDDEYTFPIQGRLLIDENYNINKVKILSEMRDRLLIELNKLDQFINYNSVKDGYFSGVIAEQEDIVSIILYSIDKIEVINDRNDFRQIEKLKKLQIAAVINERDNNKTHKEINKDIDECYFSLNNEISNIINEHIFFISVKLNMLVLPIIIDDDINANHNFFDYLNIKYLSYRSLNPQFEYRMNFVYLLRGEYGFFYCDILENRKDSLYFKNKFDELKNKSSKRKNLGTFIAKNSLIKFMPDYPEIIRGSRLLKKIIEIKKQEKAARNNALASTQNLDLNKTAPIPTKKLNMQMFKD